IQVNEICFVATDARLKDASMAAQIAAASLGEGQDSFKKLLNDPQKLLELIAAAEGSQSEGAAAARGVNSGETGSPGTGASGMGGGGTGTGPSGGTAVAGSVGGSGAGWGMGRGSGVGIGRDSGSGTGPGTGRESRKDGGGLGEPTDDEIYAILQALTTFGKVGSGTNPAGAAVEFQGQVAQLPLRAQDVLRNALAGIAEQGKNTKLDQGMLVKLAEHLSIRFALERFERGEVKVNAVRQMLDRMNQEIEALRKILGQHEDKMTKRDCWWNRTGSCWTANSGQ